MRPFPNVEDGKWRVSRDGGGGPVWRADGREIFYRNGDAMMAVTVETGAGFEASHPELLSRDATSPSSSAATMSLLTARSF